MNISISGMGVKVRIDGWSVVLYPDKALTGIPQAYRDILESKEVQDFCNDYWTPEKLAEWEQIKAEEAANEPPHTPKIYTASQFFDLFTREQWKAIRDAAKTDDNIDYLMDKLRVSPTVDPHSQTVIDGVNYLVSKGLISKGDAERIL